MGERHFAEVTRQVWMAVWKIVLPGAALGVAFMLAGELTPAFAHAGGVLLKEIGTGFIVARSGATSLPKIGSTRLLPN